MTPEDRMSEQSDCGHDAAAYVLGALESEEAAAFRVHMVGCVVCRDEVASLKAAADALPMSAPQLVAPGGLKRRLMAEARAQSRSRPGGVEPRAFRLRPSWPVLGRPAFAAGALVVTLALVLGAVGVFSNGSGVQRTIRASVSAGAGSGVLRLSGGQAELTLRNMPAPPQGRIYEVWLKRGSRPSPTSALFGVTSSGNAAVDVPGNLHGVSAVLVTSEPSGGSLVPTEAPVVVASLREQ